MEESLSHIVTFFFTLEFLGAHGAIQKYNYFEIGVYIVIYGGAGLLIKRLTVLTYTLAISKGVYYLLQDKRAVLYPLKLIKFLRK